MIEEMKSVKRVVADILENDLVSRNDDKVLMLEVWRREGLELDLLQRAMFLSGCSSPESIRRTRQKFQEEGLYQADEHTVEARRQEEIDFMEQLKS